MENLISVQMRT